MAQLSFVAPSDWGACIITHGIGRKFFIIKDIVFARSGAVGTAIFEQNGGLHGVSDPFLIFFKGFLKFGRTFRDFHQSVKPGPGQCDELMILRGVSCIFVDGQSLLPSEYTSE